MYEAACLAAGDATTRKRFAATAARYGFDGLVYLHEDPDRSDAPDELAAIGEEVGVDLGWGVEFVATDRASASQTIQQLRGDVDLIRVSASSPDLQRFVAEQELVDVLTWPVGDGEPVGYTVARTAAEHGVFVELDLGPVLRAAGGRRVHAIRELRSVAELLHHDDLPVVVSATPSTHLELRAPRELAAVASAIDVPAAVAERGLAGWGRILDRIRRARSDTFIEPGVRRVPDEADDR